MSKTLQKMSIIILAGGKNTRMKREKAFLEIDENRLIDRIVFEAKRYFEEIIVVTNEVEKYTYLDAIVISDLIPRQGPLAGIHAGLIRSSFAYSFVIACDMPFASMELGVLMAQYLKKEDAIIPMMNGGLQPLQAIYGKACIPVIEKHLQLGIRKTTAIYDKLEVKVISEEQINKWGFTSDVFINVNTPQEFDKVKMMAKEWKSDTK